MDNKITRMLCVSVALALVVALTAGCEVDNETQVDEPTNQLASQPSSQSSSQSSSQPGSQPTSQPTSQPDVQTENTYETPIKLYVEYGTIRGEQSTKELYQQAPKLLNGFVEEEYREIVDIMMESDIWNTTGNEMPQGNYWEQVYGEDWKYSYSIESKERLDEEMLEDCMDRYREYGEEMIEWAENICGQDGGVEELSEKLGLSAVQTGKYLEASIAFGKVLVNTKVTEGYMVKGKYIFEGSKLDAPYESDTVWYVCKVDGRWVLAEMPLRLALTYGNILGI